MKTNEIRRNVNMDTMFHAVVTLKNGRHQTLRVARWLVAKIVYAFRKFKEDIFSQNEKIIVNGQDLIFNDIEQIRFVYENGHNEYLTIA